MSPVVETHKLDMKNENFNKPLLTGVIGNPIIHSKSPKLHNFWLSQNNIDGYYVPVHVETKFLEKIETHIMFL